MVTLNAWGEGEGAGRTIICLCLRHAKMNDLRIDTFTNKAFLLCFSFFFK